MHNSAPYLFGTLLAVALSCKPDPARHDSLQLGALRRTQCTLANLQIKKVHKEAGCEEHLPTRYVASCSGRAWICRQSTGSGAPVTECDEVIAPGKKPDEVEERR